MPINQNESINEPSNNYCHWYLIYLDSYFSCLRSCQDSKVVGTFPKYFHLWKDTCYNMLLIEDRVNKSMPLNLSLIDTRLWLLEQALSCISHYTGWSEVLHPCQSQVWYTGTLGLDSKLQIEFVIVLVKLYKYRSSQIFRWFLTSCFLARCKSLSIC